MGPEDALTRFSTAVAEGHDDAAKQMISPGFVVGPASFDKLRGLAEGQDLDNARFFDDQLGPMRHFTATIGDSALLGTFDVYEEGDGCSAVFRGVLEGQPSPEPGAIKPPSKPTWDVTGAEDG
ncbi:MAG: hypothetical protein LBT54_04205 [Bifidobacteriaceae bacterium]|nr:hypothetical protein [Bifidobacteriaceae bacterium]